jgi:hypothetical protein
VTTRTQRRTIEFRRAFLLKGVDRILPPGKYDIVSDEELIEGLSFPVYRRVSTIIFVPAAAQASAIEMVTVDPRDLRSAQDRDVGKQFLADHVISFRSTFSGARSTDERDEDLALHRGHSSSLTVCEHALLHTEA